MSYPGDGWFEVRELPGIRVHVLSTGQFKTISAKLAVRLPLHPPAVTANALVPFVLRRGTRRLPTSQAITRALESMYGARVHVEVGKVGEVQLVEVRGEAVADRFIPGGVAGSGQLESLLRLLLEVLYDPALQGDGFVPTYVHQERELLRRRIEGIINNKPQYAVYRLYEEMFRGEPFALHRLGRREDLEAIEPGSLFRHYLEQLVPRRAELAVVGPVAADEVAGLVQRLSGGLAFVPRAELADPPPCQVDREPEPPPSGWREVSETQDVRQEVLALGFRTRVRFRSAQYPGLMLYNGLLGGFPHSRLFVHVRERHSLAYFAYSRLEPTKG
ncbi:MAG TPA: insulinase family protein, partial [Limnochordales bacterium]